MDTHFVIAFATVIVVAFLSSKFTRENIRSSWYECIKPPLTPPPYVFPLAWTILYIIIAYCFGIALKAQENYLILLFVINLLYNIIWCYLYFTNKRVDIAFLAILFIVASTIQIIRFTNDANVKKLMMVYLAWISFAAILNLQSIQKQEACLDAIEQTTEGLVNSTHA